MRLRPQGNLSTYASSRRYGDPINLFTMVVSGVKMRPTNCQQIRSIAVFCEVHLNFEGLMPRNAEEEQS